MNRILGLALATAVGLAGAACDGAEMDETDTGTEQPSLAPAPGDTAGGTMAGGAVIGVDSLQGAGAYLTDGEGRALYLLEGEPTDSSTCYDACAQEWPPFTAQAGTPQAEGQQVQANLIGTMERRDGSRQVTYAGHALYYYHDDQGPGETSGQDLTDQWGEWYLVTPQGEHLEGGG